MRKPRQKFKALPPIYGDQDLNTLIARIIDSFELEDGDDAPTENAVESKEATESD